MAETRDRWQSRPAFIMAAVGSAVGLGNVWRFPYMAYDNGGGAFFIPYFIALLTAGIPLLILEYGIGQMMQGSAPNAIKKINKNFEWVGWFALLAGSLISIYYAAVMAWAVRYLWESFSFSLPWATDAGKYFGKVTGKSLVSGEMWLIQWPLVLCLLFVWLAVFLIIHKGVHRVGKVVMISVPLPIIILVLLTLRGITLEGSMEGIVYYLRPDFSRLMDYNVWIAAYGQIFFSLSIGFGIMIAYASYMPRKSDISNNAFITSFANCSTSFLAGFAVFSVLGYLAHAQGIPVSEVAKGDAGSGPGLAFITYPTAICELSEFGSFWPPVISVLFFIMLLALGIDSLFSIVEGVIAGFHDRMGKISRTKLTAVICGFSFLFSILFVTRGGPAWIGIFDKWANAFGLAFVGLMECLVIGYFFRTERIRDYINHYSEVHLGGWWELCIKLVTPAILLFLFTQKVLTELTSEIPDDLPYYMTYIGYFIFICMFFAAFFLGKNRIGVWLINTGAILFTLFLVLNMPPFAAFAAAGATAFLFGGLFISINIAMKGKDHEHHESSYHLSEHQAHFKDIEGD